MVQDKLGIRSSRKGMPILPQVDNIFTTQLEGLSRRGKAQ